MASDVDICNLALGYLGDVAAVSSISPPDSSAQASHCARFYPIARDALLEMHAWGFSTTRVTLAYAAANPSTTWAYAYNAPSNVLNYLEVLDPAAASEYTFSTQQYAWSPYSIPAGAAAPQAKEFQVEIDANGNDLILTNQQDAVLRYTQAVTDTTKFPPLFTDTLAYYVASKLAGPLIKGGEGRQAAQDMLKAFMLMKEKAVESDSNQRRVVPTPLSSLVQNR
jgi:hypothetical protein